MKIPCTEPFLKYINSAPIEEVKEMCEAAGVSVAVNNGRISGMETEEPEGERKSLLQETIVNLVAAYYEEVSLSETVVESVADFVMKNSVDLGREQFGEFVKILEENRPTNKSRLETAKIAIAVAEEVLGTEDPESLNRLYELELDYMEAEKFQNGDPEKILHEIIELVEEPLRDREEERTWTE